MANPETPKSPVAEGEVIAGKYRVEKVLGVGGMGVVVAAMHIHLRQRVAIKFLLPDAGAELVTRFMREARASAKLKSEHIARVLDVAELPESMGRAPYMVMEYLDGGDLSRVLRKRGALPVDDAVDYLLQACEAIAEAHTVGIIHRDLKPANLFLTKAADGSASVKVLDFGISKDTSEQTGEEEMALTRTTAVLGSPYYMAPEQMRSTRTVDCRADIWSLGVILYQLVTKVVPFKAPTFVELALMVVNDEPKPPTELKPELPPAVEAAILRCIRKNPAERFASVAELAAVLAPYGRPGAMGSAERIARTQGAPPPVIERGSAVSIAPPPPAAVSSSGSGPQSLGSALSSGPSINLPTPTPSPQSTGQPQAVRAVATQPFTMGETPIPPPQASPGEAPRAAMHPPAAVTAQGIGPPPAPAVVGSPILSLSGTATPASPPSPAQPVRGSLAEAMAGSASPSVPPPGASTGKGGSTASTWTGAPASAPPERRSGARAVMVAGFLLGLVAVGGTVVVLKTRTGATPPALAASTATAVEAVQPPSAAPTPVAPQEPPASPPAQPPAPGSVVSSARPAAPPLGAPVSTTTTSPGARPAPRASAVPSAPAATVAAVAPPVAPPPATTPAAPPPPPPAAPPPTAKKNVLDIDIK